VSSSETARFDAGTVTRDGRYVRQRCAWCGAVLIDEDLQRFNSPVEDAGEPLPDMASERSPS
jgi:hypothetical protein